MQMAAQAQIAAIAPDGRPTTARRQGVLKVLRLRRVQSGTIGSARIVQGRTAVSPWPEP